MESYTEGILMLNWIKESNVLETTDYGFLTNLYLEVIQLAESMPYTPEGRRVQYELIRMSSKISNSIDDLEDQFDEIVEEIFEASADEILDDSESDQANEDKNYTKQITMMREINVIVSWSISEIIGPVGDVPRSINYDFSEYDRDMIEEAVDEWYDGLDMMYYVDLDDESGEATESETLEVEFDDDLAPITVKIDCEIIYSWTGDDNYDSSDGWEEA